MDFSVRPSAYAHLLSATPKPPNYVQGSSGKYAGSPRPAPSTTPSPLHHRDRAPGLGQDATGQARQPRYKRRPLLPALRAIRLYVARLQYTAA